LAAEEENEQQNRLICKQESRAVAGNHRAMQDTCTESLHLI